MIDKKDIDTKEYNTYNQGTINNQYVPLANEVQGIQVKKKQKEDYSFTKRIKMEVWLVLIMSVFSTFIYFKNDASDTYIDTSKEAKQALKTHMSTTIDIGTKLMSEDKKYAGKDVTITHKSKEDNAKMYVWDYAGEDGDYVEILVDGKSIGEPFMIKNRPVSFTVPTVGKIQVEGIRDGGGGITYGVYYEVNGTSYFNGMAQGGDNVYTLQRKK